MFEEEEFVMRKDGKMSLCFRRVNGSLSLINLDNDGNELDELVLSKEQVSRLIDALRGSRVRDDKLTLTWTRDGSVVIARPKPLSILIPRMLIVDFTRILKEFHEML